MIVPYTERCIRIVNRKSYSWREEVIGEIPMLKEVKKDVAPLVEEESQSSEESEVEDTRKKKKKKS